MKVKDYIIEKLNELVTLFPLIKVSYQIDDCANSNYIKVEPKEEFNINPDYRKFETNFIIEFISQFPYDEVVFVSDDSLIEVQNPVYEVEGKLFGQNTLIWNSKIWENSFEFDFNLTLNKTVIEEVMKNYNSLPDILESINEECSIQPISEEPVVIKQAGESQYALAA